MKKPASTLAAAQKAIREFALSFPETYEDHPWGETAIKIKGRGKVFLFMGASAERLSFSVKLPQSNVSALMFDFTEPTGYGLGKSGWVSVRIVAGLAPPMELLEGWITESYRAIAPKKLVARLDAERQ